MFRENRLTGIKMIRGILFVYIEECLLKSILNGISLF